MGSGEVKLQDILNYEAARRKASKGIFGKRQEYSIWRFCSTVLILQLSVLRVAADAFLNVKRHHTNKGTLGMSSSCLQNYKKQD